jgi:precorrin-3B C17-methyltransferase
VSREDEAIRISTLAEATPEMADMQTVVIVGSSRTRVIERDGAPIVYTPRFTPE